MGEDDIGEEDEMGEEGGGVEGGVKRGEALGGELLLPSEEAHSRWNLQAKKISTRVTRFKYKSGITFSITHFIPPSALGVVALKLETLAVELESERLDEYEEFVRRAPTAFSMTNKRRSF